MSEVYDRSKGVYIREKEYGAKALELLYGTIPGRVLLKLFIARPLFSKLRAVYYRSIRSASKIEPFIEKYDVDMTGYEEVTYRSFNDFFTRKRKIEDRSAAHELVSPCDGRLLVYDISRDLMLSIKNTIYSISDILQDEQLAESYRGGLCLVFRLCVDDCHRYSFIDDGRVIRSYHIPGMLHTVRSISERYRIYTSNSRRVTVMEMEHFGRVAEIDVGALLVGCIRDRNVVSFHKLEEKGYFEYGGSTIVMLLGRNVSIDEDILRLSRQGIETRLVTGEVIGHIS